MKKPSLSTVALSATLAIALVTLSTPDPASAQRIAATLEHITVLGAKDFHSTSSNERFLHKTTIRSASETPNAQQNRFWVDFHDAFTDRALFEKVVAAHPGLEIRLEFWESLNAVSIEVSDEGVLHELARNVPGIRLIEPVVRTNRVFENLFVMKPLGNGEKKEKKTLTLVVGVGFRFCARRPRCSSRRSRSAQRLCRSFCQSCRRNYMFFFCLTQKTQERKKKSRQ